MGRFGRSGTSVRLTLHLSLTATARRNRISKGMRLLSLRLSLVEDTERNVGHDLSLVVR